MQLGKYELIEQLGQGGFGIVYKAEDPTLDRLVALKVLHPQLTVDPRFIENFKREARLMAMISHANVVSIYEIGEVDGRIFIAMQYLPGGNLDQKIKREGPIPFGEALEITRQIAKGLETGHRKNLVHRDVKPANILFDEDGNALVGDFGVAHTVQLSSMGTMSQTSTGVGTPSYRPPELWNGTPPPSPATDQYSLACVFFEMISGKILFDGETTEQIMVKLLIKEPDFNVLESEELKAVLGKAVAKDPKQRYGSMGEFLNSLAIVNENPSPEPEPVRSELTEQESEGVTSRSTLMQVITGENDWIIPHHQQDNEVEPVTRNEMDTAEESGIKQGAIESTRITKNNHLSILFIIIQLLIAFTFIWSSLKTVGLGLALAIATWVLIRKKQSINYILLTVFDIIGFSVISFFIFRDYWNLWFLQSGDWWFVKLLSIYLSPISLFCSLFLIRWWVNSKFASDNGSTNFRNEGIYGESKGIFATSTFQKVRRWGQPIAFLFTIFPFMVWFQFIRGQIGHRSFVDNFYLIVGFIWIIFSILRWAKQLKTERAAEIAFNPPA